MNIDFNPPNRAELSQRRRRWHFLLLFLTVVVAAGAFFLNSRVPVTDSEAGIESGQTVSSPPPAPEIRKEIVKGEFNAGDTITGLLGQYFSPQEIHELAAESRKVFPLSGICAGQPYQICLTNGSFDKLTFDIDQSDQLIIRKEEEGFNVSRVPIPYTVNTEIVRGEITSSLFESVESLGESAELAMSLADIFAWDVDFIRDIRSGDSYRVLLEKRFREGKPAGYGRILAAEFTNQGDTYRAFLYSDGDNPPAYYDADGNSLRKAFLRAPLAFTRISSGFSMHRFHPISKTWKAHPAIDYAAPVGTPIKTVGDGTIFMIGRTRFNGNFIKIRHSNGYETIYLHMSGFARGMKKGRRVSQGQVIGYVGATGLATGPHLCFRMRKNGAPVNPNRIKSAAAAPISKKHLAEYEQFIRPLLASLQGNSDLQARAEKSSLPESPVDGENR
jgi:murein DD-endopeptidase MepM/ murein hydrolase activator NlpD